MFNFFKKKEKGTGALEDFRSEREKNRDYKFNELVASASGVTWVDKPEDKWRTFPIFDQNGSGSCVAQTAAKLLGVSYWLKNKQYVHFSATDIYQQRVNKPSGGMIATNAFDIVRKNGATLEELAPSQNLTDAQMDETVIPDYKREVGKVFRVSNYITVPARDIETVASIIQTTGKAVMVWFYFRRAEWTDVPKIVYPDLKVSDSSAARHSVTAVDFTLYKGKKALIIEDSWGYEHGKGGRRIITEDFFSKRNYFAGYLMNFHFDTQATPKPAYTFKTTMEQGQTTKDIRILQDILKYEGVFPTNVDSTGYYGGVTSKGVYEFQKKYKVASITELDALQGTICGPKTLDKLNQLYGV